MLHERKIESGYGDSVVKRLSADLKERYPKMGVSPRNLWYMKHLTNFPICGRDVAIDMSGYFCPRVLNYCDSVSQYLGIIAALY